MSNLKVKCVNHLAGCPWQGKLADFQVYGVANRKTVCVHTVVLSLTGRRNMSRLAQMPRSRVRCMVWAALMIIR